MVTNQNQWEIVIKKRKMDETNWSSDFYSDALESFSYINKYFKTAILAFCYWHN